MISFPFSDRTRDLIRRAVVEDLGSGDITTRGTLTSTVTGRAVLTGKAVGVFCGLPVFEEVFRIVDSSVILDWAVADGHALSGPVLCCHLSGPLDSILIAERTALNFVQRLCGIATLTARYVKNVSHTSCRILDTRKTTPLWRELEKYAVRTGGGMNHRTGLYDMFLVKENHIAAAGGIGNAIRQVLAYREKHGLICPVEVEVRDLDEVKETLNFPIERIMLDNMTIDDMNEAVRFVNHACEVEASGGVSLETVAAIAETGVDYISVGSLTHSAPALDLSLLVTSAG